MAYDTTLHDRLDSAAPRYGLREGYIADWRSQYFPQTGIGGLAAVVAMCGVFLLAALLPLGAGSLWRELQTSQLVAGIFHLGGWDALAAARALSLALLTGACLWAASRRGVDLLAATLVACVAMLPALAAAGDPRPALFFAPLLPLGLMAADRIAPRRGGLFAACLLALAASYAIACGWLPMHGIRLAPIAPLSLAGVLFFLTCLPAALVLRWSPRPVAPREAVLLTLAAAAALFLPAGLFLWAAVATWALAPHAAVAFREYPTRHPVQADRPNSTRTLIAMATVFTAILLNPATSHLVLGAPREAGRLVGQHAPLALAEEIESRHLTGALFTSPGWEDYLAWHSQGRLMPIHLASDEAQHLAAGGAWWLTIVDRAGIDYLALDRHTWPALARIASSSPRADVIYQDEHRLLVRILPPVE